VLTSLDLAPVAITLLGIGVVAMILNGKARDGLGELIINGCFLAACAVVLVAVWLP
jgi:hypothetical protein